MLPKRTKIDTANLERGMYVAQLDRPWLETPFLFQGFEIREDGEIKLLRKFCRHVYIDVGRCTLPRERVLKALQTPDREAALRGQPRAAAPPSSLAGRLMRAVTRFDPTGRVAARLGTRRHHSNQVPTAREAPQAIRAFDGAVATMTEVRVHARKGAGVDVERLQAAVRPLADSILRNQDALAWLVYLRKREDYAHHHPVACAVWAIILGRHLGFDRPGLETLGMGGMLLDIGMSRLPDSILQRPGELSAGEQEAMRKHVHYGLEMVRLTPGINADVLDMIGGHHERADGSGYPKGLQGADIPVYARIAGLVDCYDAMISQRPWGRARSPYDAMREVNALAGVQFQPEMVEQFVQSLGMFPTGSIVETNTGEIGIVVEQNPVRRLRPVVMLLLDAARQPLAGRRLVDLGRCPSDPRAAGACWIVRGHEAGAFGLDPRNYFIA